MSKLKDFYSTGGGGLAGSVIPFIGGYFTNGTNGGFVSSVGNTIAQINAYANPEGYYVCDGSELNIPDNLFFGGSGRYLPNLTDDRFIMGDLTVGGSGGENSSDHTHTIYHTHTTASKTLTEANLAAHGHRTSTSSSPNGDYLGMQGGGEGGWGLAYAAAYNNNVYRLAASGTGSSTAHNHGNTGQTNTSNSGGASKTENRPKFLSAIYVMKVE